MLMNVVLIRSRAIDQAVNKIAQSLNNSGHNVTLLVWDRQSDLNDNNNNNLYNVATFRLKAPYDKYTALIYLPIWWIFEFIFLVRRDIDVIHACDFDTILPVIFLKNIKKFKLCYIIYDFYANNLPNGQFGTLRKLLRYIIALTENYCIGFSDVLFLVDEARLEEVKHSKIKKVIFLYNSPQDEDKVASHIEQKDGMCSVFYAGLILKSRGIEYIIKAVSELSNIKLILAGKIGDENIISASKLYKDRIFYIGWLPTYHEVISRTLESDILFRFSDPKLPKTRYESPNKLFEAMMCGKPIVVSDGSSMANIVKKENCGLVVPYGDVPAIKETMIKLKDDLNLRQKLGENGRKAYENKYSWVIMERRLIDAYCDLEKSYNEERAPI